MLRPGELVPVADTKTGGRSRGRLDASGNPVREPVTIAVGTAGFRAARRDGRVRAAISTLLDLAGHQNCSAVVVENLNFADARAAGRETLGRGKQGKRLRATIAGMPTGNSGPG